MAGVRLATMLILSVMIFTGCVTGDETPPTVGPPTATIVPLPTPSPTSGPPATATYTAALDAILIPGPPLTAPSDFFFLNEDDLWQQTGVGEARPALTERDIGPWVQTPDGSKVAVVIYDEGDEGTIEELRIVQPDLSLSEPIVVLTEAVDPVDTAITALAWSWDGNTLAVGRSDGTAVRIQNLSDPTTSPTSHPVALPGVPGTLDDMRWAPSGAGVAFLVEDDEERGSLFITPNDEDARPVISSDGQTRAIQSFDWLAGRGRLVFVEQPSSAPTGAPGSIFTIAPDGTALELLVSSGQFAPAASVALLAPAWDGRQIAFTVHIPNANGELVFQSLWVQTIDSGQLIELTIEPGYRVTDLWWTAAGLCWRGVDLGARGSATSASYSGTEPFILGRSNIEDGTSSVLYRSNPRTR